MTTCSKKKKKKKKKGKKRRRTVQSKFMECTCIKKHGFAKCRFVSELVEKSQVGG